jgi:DNA (cytosine-5)-methyltransferase 1
MTRPKVLDLFSGAGGAAMGYWRAGFNVVGVDLEEHDDFPFRFMRGDALEVLADVDYVRSFDLVHASPPCQAYSTATANKAKHPDLVGPVRDLLLAAGVDFIIENVPQAPLINPVRLCGSSFGLRVRRHRDFESNLPLVGSRCDHKAQGQPVGVYGDHWDSREFYRPDGTKRGGKATSLKDGQDAMGGMTWMNWADLKESIPMQYTEHLGRQAITQLTTARAA